MKIVVHQDPKTWTHFSIKLLNKSQLGVTDETPHILVSILTQL